MAFKIGSTNVVPGIYNFPTNPATGVMLYSTGSTAYWSYPGDPNTNVGTGFRFRTIITHGYLAGGYKGSNPWRSLNKTWHATDITYYLGEQLDRAAAYLEGTFSDYNGYVHGTVDAFQGSSVHTSSYNLHNGTARQWGDGSFGSTGIGNQGFGTTTDDPNSAGFTYGSAIAEGTTNPGVGGWNMSVSRDTHGCSVNQIGQVGYITGGGSAVTDKMHFPTEIMYTTNNGPGTGFTSGCHGENRGYFSVAGTRQYILFSNDSWNTWSGSAASPDGWCKILSSKYGHHYAGNGTNVTIGTVKFSDSTGTDLTSFNKLRAYGEENYQMGQDYGYMLGNYDNQQNNMTVKFNYSTDSQTLMGAITRPKGHYGQSSGASSSAAASITSAYGMI